MYKMSALCDSNSKNAVKNCRNVETQVNIFQTTVTQIKNQHKKDHAVNLLV